MVAQDYQIYTRAATLWSVYQVYKMISSISKYHSVHLMLFLFTEFWWL